MRALRSSSYCKTRVHTHFNRQPQHCMQVQATTKLQLVSHSGRPSEEQTPTQTNHRTVHSTSHPVCSHRWHGKHTYLMHCYSHLETVLARNSALFLSQLVLNCLSSLRWLTPALLLFFTLLLHKVGIRKRGAVAFSDSSLDLYQNRIVNDSTDSKLSHIWCWSH